MACRLVRDFGSLSPISKILYRDYKTLVCFKCGGVKALFALTYSTAGRDLSVDVELG